MSIQKGNINSYEIFDDDTEDNSSHTINFQVERKQLGRKRKEEINENINEKKNTKRTHTKYKKDNMRSKIMTHFSNFVISFLNDYGKKFYPEEKNDFFKKVDYKLRKRVNIDSINNIMKKTLREFCELKVSTKNKDCENLNLNSLHLLSNYFEDNFFDIKLYDFYTNFYLSKDIEKLERYYGITNQTKNFECLLEKNKNEIEYKNALKETGYTLIEFANQKSENKIFIFNQNFNDLKERKEFEFMKYGSYDECKDNLITNQFSEEAISNFNPLINSDSPLINLHENEKMNSLYGGDENTLKDFFFYNNNETLFNPE